jgi:NADH dehydrogenase [ubiquinone] 1 alpha subcomplex assembly factor 2
MACLASWIQWLRHTRHEAPTINEQQLNEIRQAQVKQLAAQADARWASKPSYLDAPSKPVDFAPASLGDTSPTDELSEADIKDAESGSIPHVHLAEKPLTEVESQDSIRTKRARKEVRWEDLTLGKSDGGHQPQPWTPRSVKRR